MAPTIPQGARVKVVPFFGSASDLRRWQVVLHRGSDGANALRRVAGLPGERVTWQDGAYAIDGRPLVAPAHVPASYDDAWPGAPARVEVVLGPDEVFLVADVGTDSLDSRELGSIPERQVLGVATEVDGTPLP